MAWAGHVAGMEYTRDAHRILVEKPEENKSVERCSEALMEG
jgi:hypothetical protein